MGRLGNTRDGTVQALTKPAPARLVGDVAVVDAVHVAGQVLSQARAPSSRVLAAADVAHGRDPRSDVLRQSWQRTDVVAVAVHVASEIVTTLHVTAVVLLVSAPWWPYSSLVVVTLVGTLSSWPLVSSALAAAKHAAGVVVWAVRVAAVVVSASAAASVVAESVTAARRPTETTGATSAAAISRARGDTPCDGARPRPCHAPRMTRRATEQETWRPRSRLCVPWSSRRPAGTTGAASAAAVRQLRSG